MVGGLDGWMDVYGSGLVETTVVVAECLTCLGLGLTVLWFIRTLGKIVAGCLLAKLGAVVS